MQVASCVGDLSGIASVVVSVVVDVLNPSVRQVDRVVAMPAVLTSSPPFLQRQGSRRTVVN